MSKSVSTAGVAFTGLGVLFIGVGVGGGLGVGVGVGVFLLVNGRLLAFGVPLDGKTGFLGPLDDGEGEGEGVGDLIGEGEEGLGLDVADDIPAGDEATMLDIGWCWLGNGIRLVGLRPGLTAPGVLGVGNGWREEGVGCRVAVRAPIGDEVGRPIGDE